MAKYPRIVKPWVTRPYVPDSDAWDEAKRQCRSLLYEWAAREYAGTYTELTEHVTAIDWPEGPFTHHGRQVGTLLGQVSMEELDRVDDHPLLSSLVIGYEENMPSSGFWDLVDELSGAPYRSTSGRSTGSTSSGRRARSMGDDHRQASAGASSG